MDDLLKNPTEPGASETRLKDAIRTRELVEELDEAHAKRSQVNAIVQGAADGNPPFKRSELKKHGQAYRANFSTGEMEAFREQAVSAFFDAYSSVPTLATVTVGVDSPFAGEWVGTITSNLQWLLEQDEARVGNMEVVFDEMVMFSCGMLVFEDEYDWRPHLRNHCTLRLPKRSPSNVKNWNLCAFRLQWTVDDLFDKIADEEHAQTLGWDVAACKAAILRAGSDRIGRRLASDDWELLQREIRANDITFGEICPPIDVAQVFVKEQRKSESEEPAITEVWVDMEDVEDRYLYKRTRKYKCFSEVVVPFYLGRGNGEHHSIREWG